MKVAAVLCVLIGVLALGSFAHATQSEVAEHIATSEVDAAADASINEDEAIAEADEVLESDVDEEDAADAEQEAEKDKESKSKKSKKSGNKKQPKKLLKLKVPIPMAKIHDPFLLKPIHSFFKCDTLLDKLKISRCQECFRKGGPAPWEYIGYQANNAQCRVGHEIIPIALLDAGLAGRATSAEQIMAEDRTFGGVGLIWWLCEEGIGTD